MKLSAEEYCQLFRMDQPNYNFNRDKFMKKFGMDFINSLKELKEVDYHTYTISYGSFKREVSKAQELFQKISKILIDKGKKPLSQGLWGVFYASYVIGARKILFKHLQEKIDFKKGIAEERWAPLKEVLMKLKSDEHNTKNKPSEKG